MGCKNCKCKNKMNQKDYDNSKELLKLKIKYFDIINYVNEEEENIKAVEVGFEDYILEIDDIKIDTINLDTIIDYILENSLVHL